MRYGTASKFLPDPYFKGFQSTIWYGSISPTIHVHAWKKDRSLTWFMGSARYGTAKDHISRIGILRVSLRFDHGSISIFDLENLIKFVETILWISLNHLLSLLYIRCNSVGNKVMDILKDMLLEIQQDIWWIHDVNKLMEYTEPINYPFCNVL